MNEQTTDTDAATFHAWPIAAGLSINIPRSPIGRIHLTTWLDGYARLPQSGSACVLPTAPTTIVWQHVDARIGAGCFAQVPGGAFLLGGAGLIIHTLDYRGLTQMGGPVEDAGRLKYIDGCSDTLLISPAVVGEPCLNLLHLPAGTTQTEHTHPSDRIGIILRGAGLCRTPAGETPLAGGMFWYIPAEYPHSFHTRELALDVLAWHPDSDFGPSHDHHPMVNRTIVAGAPANAEQHRAIRTT